MEDLFQEIGPWPLLEDNWNEEGFDLIDLLLKMRHYDRKYLISVEVMPDLKDASSRIIAVCNKLTGIFRG